MARPARFIDAHVHLWDLDRLSYPWLTPPFTDDGVAGNVAPIATNYLLDDYLADAEGWNVEGIVHVDAGAAPEHALDETRWLQSLADQTGMPSAIVAFAPLDDPQVEGQLEAQAAHANVCGIRHIANWHENAHLSYTPHDLTRQDQWQQGYALLGKYGLSFDCQIYPGQMQTIADLAARHDDIPVILNHAGMLVERSPQGLEQWRAGMAALAALPHISVKLSGFGIVEHDWSEASIRPLVLDTIETFGTERCMFASDFPTDKLFGTFGDWLTAFTAITADFSEAEREAMFAGNAERIYRIGQGR